MFTIESFTTFLGWCTFINIALMCFAFLMLIMMKGLAMKIHMSMFPISEADLARVYFQYFAQFKLLVLIFNLTPWLALKFFT